MTATLDMTDQIAVRSEQTGYAPVDRDEAIKAIRAALKRRSGKLWSVKGGRGTGWGWIEISAPPRRCTGDYVKVGVDELTGRDMYELVDGGTQSGLMTPSDVAELTALLGMDTMVSPQGVSVPAASDYRREYIERAEGRKVSTIGKPYWD